MQNCSLSPRAHFACVWLVLTVMGGTSAAQTRSGCQAPQRPSIGGAFGRSSPSVELAPGAVDLQQSESATLLGGPLLAARADASVVGPLRVRLEGSTTWWSVLRRTYSTEKNHGVVDSARVGRMAMRQVVASVGVAGGRYPLCAHLMVGGGRYSLGYRRAAFRHRGWSITGGLEVPAGRHGVLQTDVHFHLIDSPSGYPMSSSRILVAGLTAGWAYRF
jgi:hypothetical protein